jgi:hypothetical protein
VEGEEMNETNLFKKLVDIRKSVEYIQKTEKGNQGAIYVDPAVLISKIRTGMDNKGILLVPSLTGATVESISDPTQKNPDAKSFLFRSNMTYSFIDSESGEKLDVPWFITGKHLQDPAMAGGVALTYYERYFLLKFFQIPTSKDDPEYFESKTATEITEDQIRELKDLIEKTKSDLPKFLAHAKADKIENIHPSKFGVLKSMLLSKVK